MNRERWLSVWRETETGPLVEDGALVLETRRGDIHASRADSRNIVLQVAPAGDWSLETDLELDHAGTANQAFVIVWQDTNSYVALKKAYLNGPAFEVGWELDGVYTAYYAPNEIGKRVRLRIDRKGDRYHCSVAPPSGAWQPVGAPVRAALIDVKVGVGAQAHGPGPLRKARFRSVSVAPLP